MTLESLHKWEKAELANILADKFADAEDLIEALPGIEIIGAMEEDLLDDFIQHNWRLILFCFDLDDIDEWIEQKDLEGEWERMDNEFLEEDYEYAEYKDEDYCRSLIEFVRSFCEIDPIERWGGHSRFSKS